MRILMVTPWFPNPQATESGIFVLRDALALSEEHDVQVIHIDSAPGASTRSGRDAVENVPVLRIPFVRTRMLDWSRVRKAVRSAAVGADVVHTHALTGLVPFAFHRPARSLRWVHTEHWSGLTSPETLTLRGRIARRILMPLLAKPDVVVVAATRLTKTIRRVRKGPIADIPCVVVAPRRVVPRSLAAGPLRLVGIGGLIPRKGPLCAVETVAELDRRGVKAHLTWVGDGPQRDEVLARAAALNLSDRVTLTGILDEAGVSDQLDRNDVFLLPTLGDNFCIVMAEALSHGRPVVSGADTGAVDYSDPAVSRFVDDDRNPIAYADAVQAVIRSTQNLSAMQIADTVSGRFSAERVSTLLVEAYSPRGAH